MYSRRIRETDTAVAGRGVVRWSPVSEWFRRSPVLSTVLRRRLLPGPCQRRSASSFAAGDGASSPTHWHSGRYRCLSTCRVNLPWTSLWSLSLEIIYLFWYIISRSNHSHLRKWGYDLMVMSLSVFSLSKIIKSSEWIFIKFWERTKNSFGEIWIRI